MKREDDFQKTFEKLCASLGKRKTMGLLVENGVSATVAERLINGRYSSRPSGLLRALVQSLASSHTEAS